MRTRSSFGQVLFTLILLLTFSAPAVAQQSSGKEEESGEEILAREQFYQTRRAGGPGRQIPPDGFARAAAEVGKARTKSAGRTAFSATLPNWVSVNPSGMFYAVTGANHIAGRTNVIAFDPLDPNVFYCGAAGGGVWKTYDGGATWAPLTDQLSALTCGALAVDPNDFLTVYFGTGEQNYSLDSYYGDGIFKSTDGGDTWVRVATTAVGRYFSTIVVDPNSSSIVYAAGSNGVYKSTNGGSTWSSTGSGNSVNSLVIDPIAPEILYCSRGGPGTNVIRKSTNSGGTWTTLTNGLPSSQAGRTQLAIAQSDPLTLYASIANSSNSSLLGLYRTTDGGATWTLQNNSVNYLGGQGWYDNSITVHPTNPDVIVVGGLDVYTSFNAGINLNQVSRWFTGNASEMSHADIHFLGFNGPKLYCGSDGGVYRSTDEGGSWSDLNATLSTLQYQSADYDPTNPQKLYGGCQDNNLQTSTDGGATWIQRETGDGGYSLVDPVTPDIVYGQYVGGSIKISGNSGVSFLEIRPAGGTGGLFYNPFELAPSDHNTVVYAQSDIWKTTDVLTTTSHSGWTRLSGPVGGNVASIGISHQNPAKMYFGTDNGQILVTTDDGATWSTTAGYPYVSDLVVDPANDAVCYATFGGFNAAAHVYKTTTSGATWFSVTGNLPNIPTNTIVLRTAAPRMLFVGTDLGVFRSVNDGTSWELFSNGLPAATVYDLKYKEGNELLLAATHGRGCFTCDVSGFAFDAAPRTIAFGSLLIGNAKQDSIVVTNLGTTSMTISSVTSSRSEFTVAPTSATIPAGGRRTFLVTFTPTPSGKITGAITFVNSSISSPDSVVLTGYGGAATVHVVKMEDADGILATTGDRSPKSWGLAVYENTVSPGTLIAQENTNHLLTLVPRVGTYIIAETDSGVPWIRLNGNKAFFDTIAVASLAVATDTIVNAKYLVTSALNTGWNMVSNPFIVPDPSVVTIFPTASTGAYAFLPGVGYSLSADLASGYGYFIKFPGSLLQTYQGNAFNSVQISVAPGWNLIGSLHRKVPVNTILHNPLNNTSSVYYEYSSGYHRSDTIVPGKGYWIKIKQLGTLTMSSSGSPAPAAAAPDRDAFARASAVTFTDRLGRAQTLYFGSVDREPLDDVYEMPPAVAEGAFDVRFASNRIAEFFPADRPAADPRILLSSAAYPVVVEWTLVGEPGWELRDDLGGALFTASLTGTQGRALLTDSRVRGLVLASAHPTLPSAFTLEQNYPNPFNPSTTVRYQLPAESRVLLRVYNSLGQEVTTLVDAQQPGGYRTVEWNGTDRSGNAVASGVYVVRLDAVRSDNPSVWFTDVRKMAVVR